MLELQDINIYMTSINTGAMKNPKILHHESQESH
jgi:hypothetical protein